MITIFSLPSEILLLVLYTTSLTRPTLVRLKFDELMINVWIIFIPIVFVLFVVLVILHQLNHIVYTGIQCINDLYYIKE